MAGAKPGVHIVQLKRVAVPKFMQEGEKFVKWDEDSGTGNPVTLKVDQHGFFLYWTNQNKDVDLLDIATIRDTRTGKGAKIPKEPRLRQIVSLGLQDTLEEKTVTVVSGPDFVNLNFINFCCTKKETAKIWADELLKIAYNLLQLNSPIMSFLMKIHSKLSIMTDKQGKIPVKNIIKTFAQNKEDRKKVEKALDASGLPSGKSPLAALPKPVEKLAKSPLLMNDSIATSKFGFEEFFTFYKNLTVRSEVERVFDEISQYNKKKLMSAEQFMEFINKEQRDPRLNEILYPYTTAEKAKELIDAHEPNPFNAQRGMLSLEGFLRYILSEDNAIVSMEKFDLSDDMDQPLNHYFINSSHNTYLTGHQLTGKSSAEMYRQCLLAGCRCIELDFWNGKTEEPIIVHGYTLVDDISAKDVIEAIAESAFKTSDYPVILSFENHCNPKQQAKIAQYCREYFGPLLLDSPLDGYQLEPGKTLPPPSSLKRRIIIKNKKKHHHHKQKPQKKISKSVLPENGESSPMLSKDDSKESVDNEETNTAVIQIPDEDVSTSSDDEDDSAEPDSADRQVDFDKSQTQAGTAGKETEAGAEISALVNYVQPVHFNSFEYSLNRNKSYEMSSFDEKQAMTLLKERPVEFVNYNKHQLSRIYPKGTRVDSANFMPQIFWNAGCQLVALNYQTLDLAMQLNLGIFELNNQCGYLLKPEFMRRKDRRFDPFAESTVDGIIAGTVSIQIISGQFLSDKRVATYVEVEMYGLPTDTIRKKFKTKIIAANGINPVYDEEPFVFKKVVLPDLACIRIAAYEESGRLIGHRVLPVVGLRPGYRHVVLRNESGQPLNLPTLFLNIRVKDYVPDGLSDFAEALANPIKYQSELEKRSKQLSVLQDDTTQDDSSANEDSESTVPSVPRMMIPKVQMSIRKPTKSIENTSSEVSASPPSGTAFPMPIQTKTESIEEGKKCLGPMPAPPPNLAAFAMTGGSDVTHMTGPSSNDVAASTIFSPDPLDKFWENKTYRDKKTQLERKVDEMRKKHEKDRKDRKPPKKSHKKLVTRLSSKNLEDAMLKKESIPASQNLIWEQLILEKDALERGYEELFKMVEKTIRDTQGKQLKFLSSLEIKDGDGVMKWVDSWRKDEFKRLAKQTKDKNELDRIKREVTRTLVDKGVVEREKKTKLYREIKSQLEQAHKDVLKNFEDCKKKKFQEIESDYKESLNQLATMAEESTGGVGVVEETFPETSFQVEELRPTKQ